MQTMSPLPPTIQYSNPNLRGKQLKELMSFLFDED